jgi:type VI protein secretion system component Hcp
MFHPSLALRPITAALAAIGLFVFASAAQAQNYNYPRETIVTFYENGAAVITTKATWVSLEVRRWTDQATSVAPPYVQRNALNFSRLSDENSATLFAALEDGRVFEQVVATSEDTDSRDAEPERFRLTLAPAVIMSIGFSSGEGQDFAENISVEYDSVTVQ